MARGRGSASFRLFCPTDMCFKSFLCKLGPPSQHLVVVGGLISQPRLDFFFAFQIRVDDSATNYIHRHRSKRAKKEGEATEEGLGASAAPKNVCLHVVVSTYLFVLI